MSALSKKLTYANVMSTLAVFLVLGGGGAAFAAGQLGKNSVGSKQLRKNAVTAAKLGDGAVTEGKLAPGAVTESKLAPGAVTEGTLAPSAVTSTKIKDGAITGAKVDASTLGTVPRAASAANAATAASAEIAKTATTAETASTFAGYTRKGVTRVPAAPEAASEAATFAAAPEISIIKAGPLVVYGKCVLIGEETKAKVFIRTTENGAIFDSDVDDLVGTPFLNVNTPELGREIFSADAAGNGAEFSGHSTEFGAVAANGLTLRGEVQLAAKHGELPVGNGIYGAGNVCLFAGEATVLNA